jgi:hypothetical protein
MDADTLTPGSILKQRESGWVFHSVKPLVGKICWVSRVMRESIEVVCAEHQLPYNYHQRFKISKDIAQSFFDIVYLRSIVKPEHVDAGQNWVHVVPFLNLTAVTGTHYCLTEHREYEGGNFIATLSTRELIQRYIPRKERLGLQ